MTSFAETVRVDAPAAAAWAFVADPRRVLGLTGDVTIQPISGSPGAAGWRFLATTRAGRQRIDAVHEVIRFEPPRLIETRVTSEGTVMRSMLQVEAVGAGTCVLIAQADIDWGGSFGQLVPRVFTTLFGRATSRQMLERMQAAIEEDAKHPRERSTGDEAHLGEEG